MNLNRDIVTIMNKRGIRFQGDIEEFLSDKPQRTYDPFLLPDMEEGVDLILNAVDSGRCICVYGDYDADGVTASTLMMDVLSTMTDKVFYYIPSRIEEGYGLNNDALDKIKEAGASLVVTVDCGSVSYNEVKYGESIGLEFVVTDHHTVTDSRAECININPNRPESQYPFKLIAGVGVAFKVAQAINKKRPLPSGALTRNLDMVAIGTVADVMPLVDENRTFIKYGLKIIGITEKPGLRAIVDKVIEGGRPLTAEDIGFRIGPMINSAGRVTEATLAADLLQEKKPDKAPEGAEKLYQCNLERKSIQNVIYESCVESLGDDLGDDHIIVLKPEKYHEGINGIVASRLKEVYKVPAILVCQAEGNLLKGTSRSIGRLNMYKLLKECQDLFEKFGGHAMACGFSMKAENFDEFSHRIKESVKEKVKAEPDLLEDRPEPDLTLTSEGLTTEFVQMQELFEPCGKGNPKPIIRVEATVDDYMLMGDPRVHIKLFTTVEGGAGLEIVSFGNADQVLKQVQVGDRRAFVGRLELNRWKGTETIQMKLEYIEA